MVLTVAQNVSGVVITSSPGPMPSAAKARCNPAVAELTASAWGDCTYALNSVSNCAVFGPVVNQPDRNVATTSLISSSPMVARLKGTVSSICPLPQVQAGVSVTLPL